MVCYTFLTAPSGKMIDNSKKLAREGFAWLFELRNFNFDDIIHRLCSSFGSKCHTCVKREAKIKAEDPTNNTWIKRPPSGLEDDMINCLCNKGATFLEFFALAI